MKLFRRIIVLIVISLLVQSGVLLYIDRFYLSNETNIKSVKVTKTAKPKKIEVQVPIPDDAKNVTTSYDSKYIAYSQGDSVKIFNTTAEANPITISPESGANVSYYKWLPDRNMILEGEKSSTDEGSMIRFYSFDVDKNKKVVIRDNHNNRDTDIYINSKFDVTDLELSTLTTMFYIKINRGGNSSGIYVIDINSQLDTISNNKVIGNMLITRLDDKLIYENLINPKEPKIMFTDSASTINQTISIDGVSVPNLLGIDKDDNIYIGQSENDKISKIFFGQRTDDTSKWKSVNLSQPVDKQDIYITAAGKIYTNDNLKGIVTDVSSGIKTTYKGGFLQLYDGGIASKSDGKLVKTNLK